MQAGDAEQRRRALQLCDMAYQVMREGRGSWQIGLVPIEIGDFRIEQVRLQPEATERRGHLPNALNIAWRERNVLTIKFSRSSGHQVVLYEPPPAGTATRSTGRGHRPASL